MYWEIPISRTAAAIMLAAVSSVHGGPYSGAFKDPTNPYDAPVPGFLGPHGAGKARLQTGIDENFEPIYENPDNYVNPLFFAWATTVTEYTRSDMDVAYSNANLALGPVTGDNFDVVSLGELTAGDAPGTITLQIAKPVRNLSGADFVVFENGIISAYPTVDNAVIGQIFGELAYVEVSANGTDFFRFPATSLTEAAVGGYGSIDATLVHNLAGKHTNAGGESWGTPFDLADVGLSEIQYVRIVDIPGTGAFTDSAGRPIYDPWKTSGSGGFDLEAVVGISTSMTYAEWPQLENLAPSQRGEADDPDNDGLPNLLEYAFARLPWLPDALDATPVCELIEDGGISASELRFLRDERLTDLTYEVQVSGSLAANDWATIASSSSGSALIAAAEHAPVITESSAGQIVGIEVVREVKVREAITSGAKRFYRVKISRQDP